MKNEIIDENNITITMDDKIKELFGDTLKLEKFISIYFDLPMENVKGNVTILNSDELKDYNKGGVINLFLCLKLSIYKKIINIKVSDEVLNQNAIDQRLLFLSEFEPMIEIWFDKGFKDIEEDSIIEKYYFSDDKGKILTENKQINHINIERCYTLWCNNNLPKFSEYEQKIIKLGAMLCTRNKEEFRKIKL